MADKGSCDGPGMVLEYFPFMADLRNMASVRVTEPVPGYQIYEIDHPLFRAKVSRHGAQVVEWQPAGAAPVLYSSPDSEIREGKSIRGGIPVCWPWFGPHAADSSKPNHGFVRTRFWNEGGCDIAEDQVVMHFHLEDDESTRGLWPHRFRLELEIIMGRELEVRLVTENRDSAAFEITGALHTYLAVGDVTKVSVHGLEGYPYFETLGGARDCPATGESLRIAQEVDRHYYHEGVTEVHDPALQRIVSVSKEGSPSTVVWNSWTEKTVAISDMPDGDYRHFLAVEAVIAPEGPVTVPAGGRHVLATKLATRPL